MLLTEPEEREHICFNGTHHIVQRAPCHFVFAGRHLLCSQRLVQLIHVEDIDVAVGRDVQVEIQVVVPENALFVKPVPFADVQVPAYQLTLLIEDGGECIRCVVGKVLEPLIAVIGQTHTLVAVCDNERFNHFVDTEERYIAFEGRLFNTGKGKTALKDTPPVYAVSSFAFHGHLLSLLSMRHTVFYCSILYRRMSIGRLSWPDRRQGKSI